MSNIVSLRNVSVSFDTELGETPALKNVSFDVPRGKITAIVGESGSGKSVTANLLMRLLPANARITGQAEFAPKESEPFDVVSLGAKDERLHRLRGDYISMVFQEPMTALSPVHTIGDQVSEAILCHQNVSRDDAWQTATQMLEHVGIPDPAARMHQYPFQFSGGMRQRVVIAMALVCNPELLICDEPTTALDVTIQAEILLLIKRLQAELGNSVLFITHDLGVVAQIADQVIVTYQGQIMEIGEVRQVLKSPEHPYTQGLIAAIPGQQHLGGALPTIDQQKIDGDYASGELVLQDDGRWVRRAGDQT